MTQKIIIFGFPHCGTSILKSILGHLDDIEEIQQECSFINQTSDKPFILCKSPLARDHYFGEKYKEYIKIFIIRNPLFVFSSLNKRFNYNIPDDHSFDLYTNIIKKFIKYKNSNLKNIYTIRYEDFFPNNYNSIKKILRDIGINYKDYIFDNSQYKNVIVPNTELRNKKPENSEHKYYRTWQINQEFVSNNDISKLDLNDIQIEQITNNSDVLQIYPDIKKFLIYLN